MGLPKEYHHLWIIYYSLSVAMRQKSYIKDTTDFINFVKEIIITQDTILVSVDATSLYTNIPQEEGIQTVCSAYENFHNNNPPIPSHYLNAEEHLQNASYHIIQKREIT